MMPTREKVKPPTKVERAFCEVESSTISWVARGVAVVVADEYTVTIAVIENVVTASIELATICRIESTES
jgi:hypothetical protein